MKTKIVKEKEQETVLSKKNYIILIIGSILIIAGYILMSSEGSTLAAYHPDIFSETRICIAPLVCLLGYLLNIFGILYRPLK
jgi:membrane-bound ClpP family serine protease